MFRISFPPPGRKRRVGTLLAVVCASTLVIVLGEPSGNDPAAAAPQAARSTPVVEPSQPSVEASPVEPSAAPTPTPTRTPPEQRLDDLWHDKGWDLSDYSASEFVQDACDMADQTDFLPEQVGESVPQALAMRAASQKSGAEALRAGVPLLCPKWAKALKKSLSGRYDRWITDDTYDIGTSPTQIPPGTYRTEGDIADCYWERTAANGDIIDNGLANVARKITVHISATDSTFTSEGCGVWTPVH
ncbi:hypothetical protein ACN6K9_004240 [Streptomyces sp. SAS_267]|uniref:hypothetical protein n=1 Tax=Streptomyces sp. SAS_267 TaxID=3412750 RepID=UPI00403C6BB7